MKNDAAHRHRRPFIAKWLKVCLKTQQLRLRTTEVMSVDDVSWDDAQATMAKIDSLIGESLAAKLPSRAGAGQRSTDSAVQ